MKRTVIVFMAALTLLNLTAYAQITIIGRDLPRTPGSQFEYYTESGDSIPVNVGTPGGPQVWDFTTGSTTTITTDLLLDPSTSPPQYSRANVVIQTDQLNIGGINEPGKMYCYLAPSRFIVWALETTYEGQTVDFFLTPILNQYLFPLQMGNTWSNTLNLDEVITIPEGDIRIELYATINSQVDAYGTVQVPYGDFETLRVRNDVTYDLTVSIWMFFVWVPIYTDAGNGINYTWLTPDLGKVLDITGQTNDPYFTYANNLRRLMNSNVTTAGVQPAKVTMISQPETIELFANYPNPFNDETLITYRIANPAEVELKVIDIMGRQVDLIERGYRDEGLHEVAWQPENLAGGLYLVHLEVEGQVSSRMMIYLK